MEKMVHVYSRRRSDFGRPCVLCDRDSEVSVDLVPEPGLRGNFIHRTPRDQASQAGQDLSQHQVNSERVQTDSRGMYHSEGGWPKDVDHREMEQTIRFRKKQEKTEVFQNCVPLLGEMMVHCIQQNNALDIYQQYLTEEGAGPEEGEGPEEGAGLEEGPALK